MSVHKNEQDDSNIGFIYWARQLQVYSIKTCLGFHKRYTFFVAQPIALIAGRIHQYAKLGNSINPTNRHEAQMRIDYFLKAKAETFNIVSQIEVASELFPVNKQFWMELVKKERDLLSGIIKADRARYRRLP